MPQKWQNAWYDVNAYAEDGQVIDRNNVDVFIQSRNKAVKSLGNMALLTSKLNTSISNANFETKIQGKSTHNGIKKYAASLVTTKNIIDVYEETKIWDERKIYEYENYYFNILNSFYKFV